MAKRTILLLMRLVLVMTVVKISVFALESASIQQQSDRSVQSEEEGFPFDPQRDLLNSSFYGKYDHYPPYCGIPSEMQSRKIPPLEDKLPKNANHEYHYGGGHQRRTKSLIGETRLIHVTAIVRHGARTPWSNEMKCWDGYWENTSTGKWDCDDLTTFMGTPKRGPKTSSNSNSNTDSRDIGIDSDNAAQDYEPALLFEKKYDALAFPEENLVNVLNGTCQMGQLLQQGYKQQIANGKMLREAYTYKEGEFDHDQRMRLINTKIDGENNEKSLLHYPNLYFRADDYQRTVMSGQVLLRSLFDPELSSYQDKNPYESLSIPLHIADEDKDILDANERDCPRLKTIKEEAIASDKYQAFYNSESSQNIREFMKTKLGMDDESSILDCFMCTMCTDRPLPNAVDDYGESNDWFTKLTSYEIQKYTTIMKHNNAQYARLGIGPLWFEIMKNINNVIRDEEAPKLALFAGHDTTLMPLLATLGPELWQDTDWASYASMMLIEIHEIIDGRSDPEIYTTNFAFRLLYNGKILTPMIDGCRMYSSLCDIVHLKAIVDPIATRDADCSASSTSSVSPSPGASPLSSTRTTTTTTTSSNREEQPSMLATSGMALFVTLVLLSGFGGSAVTFVVMRRRFTNAINNRSVDYGEAWSIDDGNDEDFGLELTEEDNFRD